MGAPTHVMLRLQVRQGELEGDGQWVYAWIGPAGVVYVGATALHPATRTWLHLHHEDPEIGRMAARYPELGNQELDVVALELAESIDRQQVRHSAVRLLDERGLLAPDNVCDPPLEAARTGETERFVDTVAGHIS
jgi:hypothetical protein